jgi:hypothetical protein
MVANRMDDGLYMEVSELRTQHWEFLKSGEIISIVGHFWGSREDFPPFL